MKKVGLFGTALVVVVLSAGAASAASYDFTYSNGSDVVSGVLTTVASAGDSQLITGITGTFDGTAISGLLPVGDCCSPPNNDNLLFPSNDASGPSSAELTLGGFAFTAGAVSDNIYSGYGYGYGYADIQPGQNLTDGTFTLSAVPEPESWALMIGGVGGVGFMLRRARKTAAVFS